MTLIYFLQILSTFLLFTDKSEPLDRWLVQLKSTDSACLNYWWQDNHLDKDGYLIKSLPVDSWYVIEVPQTYSASLKNLPCVSEVLEDQRIDWRNTEPNDPAYINQASMNMIGMPKAWDVSTGGLTSRGDTIVVAVVDNGFDIQHPDLVPNIWVNRAEIPNDQIDNDGNGYVDDYRGLNIATGNDAHVKEQHGTQVTGIIGAKGNNAMGIAGINWNIKLMLISGAGFESEVIEGYQYALDMRKKYNDTHGAQGAFVVVTNLSGGIDNAFAQDHPLWCEMYDKLGEVGILSVASGPNHGINVDNDGDMPTTCTSPYLVAVTSVDQTDVLVESAGYGNVSIDLGAPGESILTLDLNNQYHAFSGTSAAAPHVAGVIALVYGTTCTSFLNTIDSDPKGIAKKVKDIILNTAVHNNSLKDVTVTGRRIQADAALKATVAECTVVVEPELKIISIAPNPVSSAMARIYFVVKGDTTDTFLDVITTNGDFVKSIPIDQGKIMQGYYDLDTGPLPAAIYMVTLRNKKNKDTHKLFVY